MSEKNYRPEGFPTLLPYLTVVDAAKTLAFYEKAFGFLPKDVSKDEAGVIQHASMLFDDTYIMFAPEGAFGMPFKAPVTLGHVCSLNLYVYCPNVDAIYERAIAAGANSVEGPTNAFWGDRYCHLTDPDGYQWSFATRLPSAD